MEIPGTFGGRAIIFNPNYVTYGKHQIYYKDATKMAYYATEQWYSFMIGTADQTIQISLGTAFGKKKKWEVWQKLAGISSQVIEPQIIDKMVRRIFLDGAIVHIGGIQFTQKGYSRRRPFGGHEDVPWNDPIYIPRFAAGNVTVWKNKDGESVPFTTVPMSNPNAVVLPELIKACANWVANAKR
jgi:hypothetical protein